jgi:hypothetical protein
MIIIFKLPTLSLGHMAIGDPICTSQAANPESSFSFLGQIWTKKDIATLFHIMNVLGFGSFALF